MPFTHLKNLYNDILVVIAAPAITTATAAACTIY